MEVFKGIPVSPGVAIGRAFVLDDERRRIPRRAIARGRVAREHERLNEALQESIQELEHLHDRAAQELGREPAKVFAFHIGMLQDRSVIDPIHKRIDDECVSAEYALSEEFQRLARAFSGMQDTTFRTKVDDVWDLDRRVLRHLIGEHMTELASLHHEAVVISRDLTPSQTAGFDRSRVIALATDAGGQTSHTAIVARAIGIPAVVGLENIAPYATDGAAVIVDGDRGVVILNPDDKTLEQHEVYIERMRSFRVSLANLADLPSVTKDGEHITLLGNIEFPDEINLLLDHGGEGVGLFRTEFLYLTRPIEPTEDEQYEAYVDCLNRLDGRPLTVRTFDLGADKQTQSREEIPERNPALGLRSIRYCLQHLPMFRRQLRAVLRASAHGSLKVMFPLVTNPLELRQARMVLHDVMEDLDEEGIPFDRDLPIGIMVETPAAALMATVFAREVDFLSIGTNDLVQYTLAVDRTNERVASLYSAAHPAVQRLIKEVVRTARRHKVAASICGEAAGEIEFTMLLIGLGLRSLSVTPSVIPSVKRIIRSVDIPQCERLARRVGSLDSERQVSALLRDQARAILPEAFDGRAVEE